MREPRVTVVIPTLHGGAPLRRALDGLRAQTYGAFEVVVVDNSAAGAADGLDARVIRNDANVGFGAAINQGAAAAPADYVACLNDDAYPEPGWLRALVECLEGNPEAGAAASRILLEDAPDTLDSAGLALYPDGTAKQRGRGEPSADHGEAGPALLASGCAALYRRAMLEQTGGFDGDFFLYCEDADLGLRGQLLGWSCLYAPEAQVRHDYSASAGRASRLKIFHVERNRLWMVVKTFPLALWPLTPLAALWRYAAHWRALRSGQGLAEQAAVSGLGLRDLVIIVGSAHWQTLTHLGPLWRKRRTARRNTRLSTAQFWRLIRQDPVSAREIARQ